ncbi:MAG: hypothetical protein IIA87_04430 [Nanoarchaeota archaeon]|nr:hypothetical protein [Nanoarchaeota archaeon]
MNLQEIIADAAVGFVTGFGLGVFGVTDRLRERVKIYEAIKPYLKEKGREEIEESKLESMRSYERTKAKITPFLAGSFYSALSEIFFPQSGSILENAAVAIPAVYAGRIAGSATRKLMRRKIRQDLETLKQIREDPENTLDYIPEDKRRTIEESFDGIERLILSGEEYKLMTNQNDPENPLTGLFNAVINDSKIYSQQLVEWVEENLSSLSARASLQRGITEFSKTAPEGSVGIIGEPEELKLKIIDMGEGTLRIYTAEFLNLRILRRKLEGADVSTIEYRPLKLKLEHSYVWDGNYRDLARRIADEKEGHTLMTMKSPDGTSDESKALVATDVFLTAYEIYHITKSREEK